jgi:predicted HAD superfamily Cof-like phosphohydrolase
MNTLNLVKQFHRSFGVRIAEGPYILDDSINKLRIELLQEELYELAVALGGEDTVKTLDALTDLQYVLDGAYLSLGFHKMKDEAFSIVHQSNMDKLGPDGKPILREDGKILKPPGWTPPRLEEIVKKYL